MAGEVLDALKSYDLEVHARRGLPHKVKDLRRVAAQDASAVIMCGGGAAAAAPSFLRCWGWGREGDGG